MLIKNRSGRLVEVSEELGLVMIKNNEAERASEEPEEPLDASSACPYCDAVVAGEEHLKKCFEQAPLISVIIPSRVGEEVITKESLGMQTWKKFEVIVEFDKKKEGAPTMRNKGFKKANGSLVLFSDNDIEWKPYALEVMARKLREHPTKAYAYGSYTLEGRLVGHQEFSTHDLWKWNYISTMALLRKEDFPGFEPSLKKFQDWDLWLTLLEKGRDGVFCGMVLFSTKYRPDGITYGKESPESTEARSIVMKRHSIRSEKLADIIIPHQNRHDMLKNCLDGLSHDLFNIYVITGGTFSENCNKGAKLAETDNLIFMNDDIEPVDEVIREMIRSDADIVGAAQITPNWHPKKVWYGIKYAWNGPVINESMTDVYEDATIPTGFLFRVKRKVWDELGGLDEAYKNGGEDQEIFLTAREKGHTFHIVKTPTIHHHSSSRDRFKHTSDNRKLLMKRWPESRVKKIIESLKK